MALLFTTSNPNLLLSSFKKAIDERRIATWSYDPDGDFTHETIQWKYKAWLRPKIENGKLLLIILNPKDQSISSEVYAIYHGRFAESMLVHCDSLFTDVLSTSMPRYGDKVKPS
jgi:hypothetical protein